ncbi:MAG: 1-deoxy-D-xylulose-5-phosphate reductoisomerase, partial [Pseudomonadota bacterium]
MGRPGARTDHVRSGDGASRPQSLSIFGATGSIGTSTLRIVDANPEAFDIVAVTANDSVRELAEIAIRHRAATAVIANPDKYAELKSALAGTHIEPAAGEAAVIAAADRPADCVMAAIMGAAGLRSSLAAIRRGARLALANKECLVCAGDVFMREVAGNNDAVLLPVDSEHSAIFQALEGNARDGVEQVIVTASGGPFRTWTVSEIKAATLDDALKHPNWSMGRKITVDSATMMNKGLELIEARFLFALAPEQLDVVVHPQSIVHSMVAYKDGSVLAQLGMPDMRTPIAYALSWPRRIDIDVPRLDLAELQTLTFERPDEGRFPALRLARSAMTAGGGAPAVLNAANEVAVGAFLDRRIGFTDIARTVETVLDQADAEGLAQP